MSAIRRQFLAQGMLPDHLVPAPILRSWQRCAALGLQMDASGYGMGLRSKRFALYAENGVVRQLFVEAPGEFRVSSAEHVLEALPAD